MSALFSLFLLNPLWGLVILGIQLGAIVHALKSGKGQNWIYLLIFLPGLGAVAYLVVEIFLPWWRIRQMVTAAAKPKQAVKVNVEELEQEYKFNPTFANLKALADGYAQGNLAGMERAEQLYQKALVGINAEDETMLKDLAWLQMEMGKKAEAEKVWRKLEKIRAGNLRPDELLGLARCLGESDEAGKYYREAAGKYPGLETNYYYCKFLWLRDERSLFDEQIEEVKRKYEAYAPRYKREEREWWEKINKMYE